MQQARWELAVSRSQAQLQAKLRCSSIMELQKEATPMGSWSRQGLGANRMLTRKVSREKSSERPDTCSPLSCSLRRQVPARNQTMQKLDLTAEE